jgi:aryl-alcohol dehydrogenase
MKVTAAVVNQSQSSFVLEELDLEEPRASEVRVRLSATGLCHTDISVMNRPFPIDKPIVLGHEGAGVVESVGSAVTKVKPGDRVLLSYNFCGSCPSCAQSAPSYCNEFAPKNFFGVRADGSTALRRNGEEVRHNFFGQSSFATHCLCEEQNLVKVDSSVSEELFEMLGPMGCGFQTGAGAILNVLKPQMGDSVVVFGSGAVGMAAIMAAAAVGATTIIAVDRVAERLDQAKEVGATYGILADGSVDVVARIRELTGGGANVILDTTAVPTVMRQAVDALAPLGRCGLVGGAAVGTTLEIDVRDLFLHGKTLRGIVEGDSVAEDFIPKLIKLQQQGLFPIEKLVRFYKFDEINSAVADSLSGEAVKPILRF